MNFKPIEDVLAEIALRVPVRAVNAHDALVAALEGLLGIYENKHGGLNTGPDVEANERAFNAARAVLRAAREDGAGRQKVGSMTGIPIGNTGYTTAIPVGKDAIPEP